MKNFIALLLLLPTVLFGSVNQAFLNDWGNKAQVKEIKKANSIESDLPEISYFRMENQTLYKGDSIKTKRTTVTMTEKGIFTTYIDESKILEMQDDYSGDHVVFDSNGSIVIYDENDDEVARSTGDRVWGKDAEFHIDADGHCSIIKTYKNIFGDAQEMTWSTSFQSGFTSPKDETKLVNM